MSEEINSKAIQSLANAARGILCMSGMKHPGGNYTLGETGHFQSLRKALTEYEGILSQSKKHNPRK